MLMKNILEKLGFVEKKYDWYSFDASIKKLLILKVCFAVLLFILTIWLFVSGKILDGFIMMALFAAAGIYAFYQYLYFSYGMFEYLIAECVTIDRKINELFKRKYYDKCTMTLFDKGKYYIMNVKPKDEVKKGSEVIVYMSKNSLSEINENTYAIDNPIAYTVLSHPTNV